MPEEVPQRRIDRADPASAGEEEPARHPSASDPIDAGSVHAPTLDPTSQPRDTDGVAGRVRTGLKWGAADQVFQQVLRISLTVVLTRLTPPSEFGLIAMGFLVTTAASWISDLGFGSALVQRRTIGQRHIGTALTSTAVIGLVLAAATCLAAPSLADYFAEDRLALVLIVLSVNFPIKGLAGIPRDLLRRELRFKEFALAAGVSVVVSATTALVLAVNGAGVWALVAYSVVESVVALFAFAWFAQRRLGHRLRLAFGREEFSDLAGFGASVAANRLVFYLQSNVDNLIVAKALGAVALGLYGLAYRIMLYPIQKVADVIVSVAMPAFSTLQDDRDAMRAGYLRGQQFICLVCFPASVGIAVSAPLLIPVLVGDQWLAAVATVQILALSGPRIALNRLNGSVFQACGRPERDLQITLVAFALVVPALVVGSRTGIEGVAVAYTTVGWLLVPLGLVPAARRIGTTARHAVRPLWTIALATIAMAATSELSRRSLTGEVSDLLALAVVVVVGAVTYLVTLVVVDRALLAGVLSQVTRPRVRSAPC